MSTLKTINVIHPSGTTNNIVNDSSGNITVGGKVTTNTVTSAAATALAIQSAGTTAITVATNGNVGIGAAPTSDTTYKWLNIVGPTTSGGGIVQVNNSDSSVGANFFCNNVAGYIGTSTAHPLLVRVNSSEFARFTTGGALLIGTQTGLSSELLSVSGGGAYVGVFQQTTNTSGYHVLRCGLQQNGNNTSSYFLWGNTNNVGNWYLYGNGTTSFTSDSRLKKNIETTRDGYLDDIAKLRVVKYNWRNDEEGKPRELGLIAQEVEQVFPGLVQDDIEKISPDDDTVYKTVKQSVLPFILLKAIQELKAQNDALKAQNDAFEARLAALEAK